MGIANQILEQYGLDEARTAKRKMSDMLRAIMRRNMKNSPHLKKYQVPVVKPVQET